MKAILLVEADTTDGTKPAGTVIDHPDVLHLIAMDYAEPADEATAREWAIAKQARADAAANRAKRVAAGRPKLTPAKPITPAAKTTTPVKQPAAIPAAVEPVEPVETTS